MEFVINSKKYGEFKIIYDDDDHEKIKNYTWHVVRNGRFYIETMLKMQHGSQNQIKIHRLIMDCPKDKQVDHINGNTLDNRKCNLRICSSAENSRNKGKRANNTSGFKGVYWHKANKKWHAKIGLNGAVANIGYFHDKELAAIAYNFSAIHYHGEFACLNII